MLPRVGIGRGLPKTWLTIAACTLWVACGSDGLDGAVGVQGLPGPGGVVGPQGPANPIPCVGATPGLVATVAVSAPAHGGFFAPGESPTLTIHLTDRCGSPLPVASLGTASLYLSGPRQPLQTKTASKLLNCVTDRAAADRQHHFINLIAPKFNDTTQNNLRSDADGTLHYKLAPISDELPGTYTVGVLAKSTDDQDQVFALRDVQIGTATPELYSSGPADASSCEDCHKGTANGKIYLQHIIPGFSVVGNYALDQFPMATCKSCHNQDGYSTNPAIRKVHAVHRGAHQVTPGVAHPEYGLLADSSLGSFLNVGFPSMPDAEKDCTKCHKDDRWLTAPSRLGCGTCHENVFFDTGVISPPISRGKPGGKSCVLDTDCGVGQLTTCNVATGSCEVRVHPKQTDDAQCLVCHSADNNGIVPIAASHEILSRTRVRGLQVSSLTLSGGSGTKGAVLFGDTLTVRFQLKDSAGTLVTDLITNKSLATTVILGGPTDNRLLVYAPLSVAGAALAFDGTSYTYVLPTTFPATAQVPLNSMGTTPRPNPPGTYSLWLYVAETLSINGLSVRDSGSALLDFRVGADGPIQPRKVIVRSTCNTCHVTLQAHGGSRRDAEGCSLCHTAGAVDRAVGSRGTACTLTSQCGGGATGWETCQDTNADGKLDTCILTTDPTPNQSIQFPVLIHAIHYARKREGYAERNNLISPSSLVVIGFQNSVNNFQEVLLPQDVRNCTKCHADSGGTCSTAMPCGIGQACVGGTCKNTAFTQPSAVVCLSCHDAAAATGHAAIMTWKDSSGNSIETCSVCHGPDAEFAVDKVHNITSPYKPPYSRE